MYFLSDTEGDDPRNCSRVFVTQTSGEQAQAVLFPSTVRLTRVAVVASESISIKHEQTSNPNNHSLTSLLHPPNNCYIKYSISLVTMSNMNSSSSDKVEEDRPQMRSVAMGSLQPALLRVPPRSPLLKTPPVTGDSRTKATSTSTSTPLSSESTTAAWKIDSISLTAIPSYYQLERSHIKITVSPKLVAQRIATCLQQESVAAQYHDSEVRYSRRKGGRQGGTRET